MSCKCWYGVELRASGGHRSASKCHTWLRSLSAVQQAKNYALRCILPPVKVVEFNFCPNCGRELKKHD